MKELVREVKKAELPIYLDKGFGWHGFRRTFARLFIEDGGSIEELKKICAWSYTSTISHYMGDPVNRLERGSLKALAGRLDYGKFMERVQNVPLSNRTKLFVWLRGNRKLAPSARMPPKTRLKPTGIKTRQGSSVLMGKGVGVEISTTPTAETAPSTNSFFHKIEVFNS